MIGDELERQGLRRPRVQVFFHVSDGRRMREFAGLKMMMIAGRWKSMPRDFHVNPTERAEQQDCVVSFDAYRYDPAGVRVLVGRYQRLLDLVSRHSDMTLRELLKMSRPHEPPAH
jgi:hypothetical protein